MGWVVEAIGVIRQQPGVLPAGCGPRVRDGGVRWGEGLTFSLSIPSLPLPVAARGGGVLPGCSH